MPNDDIGVSICIPVYNGMDNLPELLDALRSQELVKLEIIAIDSTSSDGSWEYLCSQADLMVKQIPTAEFSHGATRQLMAEMASNEIVIFLTQDATPSGPLFAISHANLHCSLGDRVGAVLGAQHPRRKSAAAISQRVQRTFKDLGPETGVVVYRNDELMQRFYGAQPLSFLSDVNASYKKSLLIGDIPFRNVPYAEDQFMARDLLENGYDIVYSPQADVKHANEIAPREYAKRIEDELVGVHKSLGLPLASQGVLNALLSLLGNMRHDFHYILKNHKNAGLRWAVQEFINSPIYELQAIRGRRNASKRLKEKLT